MEFLFSCSSQVEHSKRNSISPSARVCIIHYLLYGALWLANCDWIVGHYSPVMPTGRLRACKTSFGLLALFLLLVPYHKQLNNLDRSVVTGKSQTSAYRNDLAIARSIRQGLSLRTLRFSRNDRTVEVIKLFMKFVMTLTKKGSAFRNIGQNNRDTYSFQCFIRPTFSYLCTE